MSPSGLDGFVRPFTSTYIPILIGLFFTFLVTNSHTPKQLLDDRLYKHHLRSQHFIIFHTFINLAYANKHTWIQLSVIHKMLIKAFFFYIALRKSTQIILTKIYSFDNMLWYFYGWIKPIISWLCFQNVCQLMSD